MQLNRLLSARWLIWLGVALGVAVAIALYVAGVPGNPPGFFVDESSIAYNAYTISQHGVDEYGTSWPLFFRAFGEYKNPVLIFRINQYSPGITCRIKAHIIPCFPRIL